MSKIQPLPIHLITGLLGSGKTTTLKQLIQQKPAAENWGIIINEFGEIDIDAASLTQDSQTPILSVSGGCVCCSAQHGLSQAINQLLSSEQPLSRIWIEPTGLGHPAKIIDTLTQSTFIRPLTLQKIVCVITPQQLTEDRWHRSAVMRDLVTLSDIILLNKQDLSSEAEINSARNLLQQCYPPKTTIINSQHGQIELKQLLQQRPQANLRLLQPSKTLNKQSATYQRQNDQNHTEEVNSAAQPFDSSLPGVEQAIRQINPELQNITAIGWVFHNRVQFNRNKLKHFFATFSPKLIRAKGILKTGNEWQLINWSLEGDQAQLTFEDIAWRQDSRLECILNKQNNEQNNEHNNLELTKVFEIQLLNCISKTT